LFEQWVGIEIWKRLNYLGNGRLHYLRTRDGAEVDFIVGHGADLIPIEVKWTEHPDARDARHLQKFIDEHPGHVERGYIICRCRRPLEIHKNIIALPWHLL
jgi:predicted AAA+ superfamily ATPase